jgi:hypothetical protein
MKVRKYLTFLFLSAVLISACEEQKTKEADPKVLEESDKPAETAEQKVEGKTSIEFPETEFDFGKINGGQMVNHVFKFKNTGNTPLVILSAKASCGCTVPEYTKDPVAPGESGEIKVTYNGSGSGQISKSVTVTSNTEPAENVLQIKANVKSVDVNSKGPFKN